MRDSYITEVTMLGVEGGEVAFSGKEVLGTMQDLECQIRSNTVRLRRDVQS